MKVSVIIAAYNAERYLTETLETVLHQTIDDYEVIVVNDGSGDSTGSILDEYSKKYSNLIVIHKENGGPSSARNRGLDIAQGEYVYFFDADDLLEADALQNLYDRACEQRADLVIAKYDIFNRYLTTKVNNINSLVRQDEIDKYDLQILWTFSLCNKLFRKKIIDEHGFRLPPISYSEDGTFLMEFVFHCRKITGLDQVIFHYRRMYDGEAESITSFVSPAKIRDYITAHGIILKSAENSILRDYPEYKTIAEVSENNAVVHRYLNEIIRKELQVLLNQFYIKFWSLDQDSVQMIVREIKEKLNRLDMYCISLLADENPDFTIFNLPVHTSEMLEQSVFTAVLYGDIHSQKAFLNCLRTLVIQNLVGMRIIVPSAMRAAIEKEGLLQKNILYRDANTENQLFYSALRERKTPYIVLCDCRMRYANNTFRVMFKRFVKSQADFMVETVYQSNNGKPQPFFLSYVVLDSLKKYLGYNDYLCLDSLTGNKFFSTDFLLGLNLNPQKKLVDYVEEFYKRGFFRFYNTQNVVFDGTEEEFEYYAVKEENREFVQKLFQNNPVTLNSKEVLIDPGKSFLKLQLIPNKTFCDKVANKVRGAIKRLPLKNQVCFYSPRKNGELEGNAKALYPYVSGKKIICARQLPHGRITELVMFYHLVTSKVIVTDDYVRYLRHFPVRPEQRVIQLWHACGAFKKFGQRGTNISLPTDRATHTQYNLVCVSGEAVRPVYADAFDLDIDRVRALGTPRTDEFFDQDLIEKTRNKLFKRYPEFQNKYIILYAPTFRDTGEGRTQFKPDLDFDKLSKDLLPGQEFVICPHPVMKNSIVDREYPNIHVIRDFSTNDMMFISDMLITDYSSVIFEYALLKKPIVFYCYDLAVYGRGFYLKYPDDLPGDVFEEQESLTEYLRMPEKHVAGEKYDIFVKKYMSACDGHSSERIAGLINDYMEGK